MVVCLRLVMVRHDKLVNVRILHFSENRLAQLYLRFSGNRVPGVTLLNGRELVNVIGDDALCFHRVNCRHVCNERDDRERLGFRQRFVVDDDPRFSYLFGRRAREIRETQIQDRPRYLIRV